MSTTPALRACERESAPFSAAVIDIDGFRELNARRGRLAGDAALIGIAARLRRLTRAGDVLGRSGADEITVVMPSTGLDGARTCCDRLIHELEEGDLPGAGVVSVSAGVSLHTPGPSLGDVLASAHGGQEQANPEFDSGQMRHQRDQAARERPGQQDDRLRGAARHSRQLNDAGQVDGDGDEGQTCERAGNA